MARGVDRIYQIKITLDNISPPIWRRIEVPGKITLGELHSVIQPVMGWEDYHLHQFDIGEQHYGLPHPDDFYEMIDEREVQIQQAVGGEKFKFKYWYDFGDDWWHTLLVEKVFPAEQGVRYPRCINGKRACPPEDVGGPWGYADYVVAMSDPNHPEHDDMIEWRGPDFDPEAFDVDEVNKRLWARLR